MEKETIIVYSKGSGVKGLETLSVICYVVACLMVAGGFIYSVDSYDWLVFLASLAPALLFTVFGALLRGQSTIAKTALYKRIVMEQKYEFTDIDNLNRLSPTGTLTSSKAGL